MNERTAQFDRYRRQTILRGFGVESQQRLADSHAIIIGVGALGCASADLLARAGVGTLTLVDRDVVELTNLQRQCLFDESDATERRPKAEAGAARLARVNSSIRIQPRVMDVTSRSLPRLLRDAKPDVIVDGTDNAGTRYLLNDAAVRDGIPFVYGGVIGTRGMQMTVLPGESACLRCVFEDPPAPGTMPTCDTSGVLGPAVSIVAGCQAADAIKVLVGRRDLIQPTLLEFDLWSTDRRRIDLSAMCDPAARRNCPCCGRQSFEFLEGKHDDDVIKLCGQVAVQIGSSGRPCDLDQAASTLRAFCPNRVSSSLLRVVLVHERSDAGGSLELSLFADGRAIVQGTADPARARGVLAKYIGA
ncbi:MAG: ThiF family adenylyltransferase [Phycisphaerales bacterium]|nr:ThiF family adenylyltransferase [Phycisphaerales bacterium]